MSAIRAGVRLATVAALRDRTWIKRVADSANTPIDQTIIEEPTPYASVFVDDDDSESADMEAHDGKHSILLVIEFGVSRPLLPEEGGDSVAVKVGMPTETDDGFELILDAMELQIERALQTDPYSQWGTLWKGFTRAIVSVNSKRGASAEKGIRWAARQRLMRLSVIDDPPPGFDYANSQHILPKFVAAMRASSERIDLAKHADFFEAMFMTDKLPDWRVAQGWLTLTGKQIRHLGIAPIFDADGEPPLIAPEEGSIMPLQQEHYTPDDDYVGSAD